MSFLRVADLNRLSDSNRPVSLHAWFEIGPPRGLSNLAFNRGLKCRYPRGRSQRTLVSTCQARHLAHPSRSRAVNVAANPSLSLPLPPSIPYLFSSPAKNPITGCVRERPHDGGDLDGWGREGREGAGSGRERRWPAVGPQPGAKNTGGGPPDRRRHRRGAEREGSSDPRSPPHRRRRRPPLLPLGAALLPSPQEQGRLWISLGSYSLSTR